MFRQFLGRYGIIEQIGAGGMGVVYRAHDERLGRDVAIKVLPEGSFADARARARLLREARSAAALSHPHICTVHEVGEDGDQVFIVMELVEGDTLHARLASGALSPEKVLRLGTQLPAAEKALQLGGGLAETQTALAEIKLYSDWDPAGAEPEFRRAIELNPSLPEAHAHYGWCLNAMGRVEEGFESLKRAQEVDPLTPLWPAMLSMQYHDAAPQDGRALEAALKALQLNPDFPFGLYALGNAYAAGGNYEEAIAAHRKAAELTPALRWPLGTSYAAAGRKAEALKVAAELESNPTPMNSWGLAEIFATLGEREKTLKWLAAARDSRFSWMPWMASSPAFAPLRSDPDFQALARSIQPRRD